MNASCLPDCAGPHSGIALFGRSETKDEALDGGGPAFALRSTETTRATIQNSLM